jgi:hypothetical protein
MRKRVMLGLAILVALVWGSAYGQGCIGSFCSNLFNRMGTPAGDIIAFRGAYVSDVPACTIATLQGTGELLPGDELGILLEPTNTVTMKLAGTVPTSPGQPCGLGAGEDECNVLISVHCTDRTINKAETKGPLLAGAFDFNQSNNGAGPDLANFSFKLTPPEGDLICAAHGAGLFQDFALREAFFEACVNADCTRNLCKADQGGGNQDRIRPLHCRPVR